MATMLPSTASPSIYTSSILVRNIHCPSCVSYVEDILRPLAAVQRVDVSLIDQTVRVQHTGGADREIVQELLDAAFEIQHITVTDNKGHVLKERDVHPRSAEKYPFNSWHIFMSKAQRKHIANCDACQESRRIRKRTTWSSMLRSRRTSQSSSQHSDIEQGLVKSDKQTTDGTLSPDKNGEIHTTLISIEGMTCASCSSAVTRALKDMEGVEIVDVNLLMNTANVTFHGAKSRTVSFVEAIEDLGYGASIEQTEPKPTTRSFSRASLSIEGMTCGSCVGTVTQGVQDLSFVRRATVDLIGNSAHVEYEGEDNLSSIIEKIGDLGYGTTVVNVETFNSEVELGQTRERTVQIQITGMYCPRCPANIEAAILEKFGSDVQITCHLSLRQPRLALAYQPTPPSLTIRSIVQTINSVDPACSASIYHPPSLEERSRTTQRRERNRILRHLLITFLSAIPTFIIGIVYADLVPKSNATRQWFEQPIWSGQTMRSEWALFILTTPVMFYGASLFHTRALKEIWSLWRPRSRVPILRRFYRFGSMNLLISAGTSVAYFASLAVLIMDATSPPHDNMLGRSSTTYFDTVTFLTFFILVGRFLEAYSKAKTGDAVSMLSSLRPREALLVETETTGDEKANKTVTRRVPVEMLEARDSISIPHGTCPPTDCEVEQEGSFLFDESSLTGESRPVKKTKGDKVYAGSVNISDPVRVTVLEVGGRSMLDQIVNVVRDGQARRAPIERLADILTGYFTPVITLLAILTWIIWLALGESGVLPRAWLDVNRGGWAYWSVEFAIAVFVVACPCGIGLAAPTALFVGGGLAAKSGVLVQGGGEAFQEASKMDTIVLDKTGTLTEGKMRVTEVGFLSRENEESGLKAIAYAVAKAMEQSSTHPIAKAVVDHCDAKLAEPSNHVSVVNVTTKEISGHGMTGVVEIDTESGYRQTFEALIGNERLLRKEMQSSLNSAKRDSINKSDSGDSNKDDFYLDSTLSKFHSLGCSTAILALRKKDDQFDEYLPTAVFAMTDPVRSEAPSILAGLRSKGVDVHMCTGDNPANARVVASQLNIPVSNVRAGVLPTEKAAYIKELQHSSDGKRRIVAFVGDGTNDTPALTVADVSIAISHPSGSDIALTSSSFILLNSNLKSILSLVSLSKRVFLRVKLNFMWAAVYNICLIPVAAGVFFPIAQWRLSPVWASLAMAGSSVSVVLSSLALKLPEMKF